MAVGVAGHQSLGKAQTIVRRPGDAGRHEAGRGVAERIGGRIDIGASQVDLPVPEVARAGVGGKRPAVARGQVLEELDARAVGRAQRGYEKARAENVVQPLLLETPVFSLSPATCRLRRSRQKARLASVSSTTIAV